MHEATMRKLITTAAIAALGLMATAALAGPAPEQKCQAANNSAAGKSAACRQAAEKSLVSTSDAAKYGESIAKCEAKFTTAWQKAIDAATEDGATCPDAPLAAGDYKSVIDSHSGNIATALGGGGLTLPSTCGNGTLESGEDCDFTTPLPTCSAATAGAQPFGQVTCGAGCASNIGGCQSCAGIGGRSVAGACWFEGSLGGSCSGACSARGLVYDPATAFGAGYDGCWALLLAFAGESPFNQIQGGAGEGTACNFFNYGYAVYNSQSTSADATTGSLSRVCACQQP
jgi:hypothetical protein